MKWTATIISEKNKEKIMAYIGEVQGKARTRTVTWDDIMEMCTEINERFDISKKAMDGVACTADYNAQTFPNAYKYVPESTICKLLYKNGEWRLLEARRGVCKGIKYRMQITAAAESALLSKYTNF